MTGYVLQKHSLKCLIIVKFWKYLLRFFTHHFLSDSYKTWSCFEHPNILTFLLNHLKRTLPPQLHYPTFYSKTNPSIWTRKHSTHHFLFLPPSLCFITFFISFYDAGVANNPLAFERRIQVLSLKNKLFIALPALPFVDLTWQSSI